MMSRGIGIMRICLGPWATTRPSCSGTPAPTPKHPPTPPKTRTRSTSIASTSTPTQSTSSPPAPPTTPRRSGTSAASPPSSTPSTTTPPKSSSSRGPPSTRASSPPAPPTAASTSGTSHGLGGSRSRRTRRTGPRSCCLFMGDIRVRSRTFRGTRTMSGCWRASRRIIFCRCGRWRSIFTRREMKRGERELRRSKRWMMVT
mmetsp:Transcript_1423/g.3862  ORF Transcript_1423/g.3862 Transcript_1423/m.3862 type:complete len:201 (+) Transcript_1423:48-650(+)